MKLSICFHCVDVFLMLYFPVEDAGVPGRQGLSNREAFDARNILKVRHSVLSCTWPFGCCRTTNTQDLNSLADASCIFRSWIQDTICWTWLMQFCLPGINTLCGFFSCGWHFQRPVGILDNTTATGELERFGSTVLRHTESIIRLIYDANSLPSTLPKV